MTVFKFLSFRNYHIYKLFHCLFDFEIVIKLVVFIKLAGTSLSSFSRIDFSLNI